jgi:hypothetical protein
MIEGMNELPLLPRGKKTNQNDEIVVSAWGHEKRIGDRWLYEVLRVFIRGSGDIT